MGAPLYKPAMATEKKFVQRFADLFNEALETDPKIGSLLTHRAMCGEKLLDHPTIQVGESKSGTYSISMLGLLNGVFAQDGDVLFIEVDKGKVHRFGSASLSDMHFER